MADRKKTPRIFTPAETNRLRAHVQDSPYRIGVELLIRTGLRLDELLRLKVEDVDIESGRIRIAGPWAREVSLNRDGALVFFLRRKLEFRGKREYIVPGKKAGQSLGPRTLTSFLRDAGHELGINGLNARNLRTTAIVRTQRSGVDDAEICRRFGVIEKTARRYRNLAGKSRAGETYPE